MVLKYSMQRPWLREIPSVRGTSKKKKLLLSLLLVCHLLFINSGDWLACFKLFFHAFSLVNLAMRDISLIWPFTLLREAY